MGKSGLYQKLSDVLAELLCDTESIDMMMLSESFIRTFTTVIRNSNENTKNLSFTISDGERYFSIDIDMENSNQLIQKINMHEVSF